MDLILIIIMGILLIGYMLFKAGDLFAPWTITTAVWLAIVVMFQFQGDLLYPLGTQFHTSLALWLPIFCASSLLTYYLLPAVAHPEETSRRIPETSGLLFTTLYVISMVITPLYLYKIMQVVMMFDTADMLNNLRLLAVFGDEKYGFLNYSYVLNQVLIVVALWRYPKVPLWQVLTIVAAGMMSAFAIMEKGMLFFLFASLMYILYQKRVIRLRSIFVSVIVVVLVFFLINLARDYTSSEGDSSESMSFLDFFAIYVLSPPAAFERISQDISTQFGSHTFQTVYLFLNRFGGDFEVNTKLQEFVWVPLPTNVYTVFQPFFMDFGYRGVAFFALVYGVMSGWIYRYARNGNGFAKCVYAFAVYVLILQFYQENVMMSLVNVIQFVFFTWLVTQQQFALRWDWGDSGSTQQWSDMDLLDQNEPE
ncbi:MAG: oligosaccharide repeat unit polymerase [Prevotella sp.]|nr:oligosaccharide repeat unit polymerase [Prevotella sp.]